MVGCHVKEFASESYEHAASALSVVYNLYTVMVKDRSSTIVTLLENLNGK